MNKISEWIVTHQKIIIFVFVLMAVISAMCQPFVSVNYDINDYLPDDSPSTIALDVMAEEFEGDIPNLRVMISDVTVTEALQYKEKLEQIEGVEDVTWLDDSVSLEVPLEMQDQKTIETYYKNQCALFSVTVEEENAIRTVNDIRKVIGDDNAMTGSAASTAVATENTVTEVSKLTVFAVIFVFFVLCLTTHSWIEPVLVMVGLGISVIINNGTNLLFGEISFVTNAAGSVLQIAVSLDYSIFLIHRFEEYRKSEKNDREAMILALKKTTSSILSSGLTTVIGFFALTLMKFKIGPDLGIVLAKGIAISLITVIVFMPPLILKFSRYLDKTQHRSFMPDFHGFGRFVSKRCIPMFCIFILIVVPACLGANANDYYYGSEHIYDERTQYGQDTNQINDIFGKNDTYVLLVPKGDFATEKKLSDDLHDLPEVTDIISYVDTVGAEIPVEYLTDSQREQLISQNYSRMVLSVNTDTDSHDAFGVVEEVRDTAKKYYSDEYYLAGAGVSTYDLMDTITVDMQYVNMVAIGAIFLVLLLTLKSISLPVILVLCIEGAVWINVARPYFFGNIVFYISYLIISSVQLGATVDYAILFTDRYMENRKLMNKRQTIVKTISSVMVSIITSASVMTIVGFLMSKISTHGILEQLGDFLAYGTVLSFLSVVFVLPGFLYLFDSLIEKTTYNIEFYKSKEE